MLIFLYLSRIIFVSTRSNDYGSKSGVENFFGELFLNKFELYKLGVNLGIGFGKSKKKIAPMFITHQVAQFSRLIQKSKMTGAKCETLFINLFKSFNNPI